MSGYNYLKGSDGSGNAVLAHVTLARLVAATVLKVDSVSKWPVGGFIATVGTLDGTGFLIPASITEFTGHITGSDIIIDGFESGFTDLGNSIGQVVVIKQTTGWANSMVANAKVSHNDDGTHQDTAMDAFFRPAEQVFDYVVPGGAVLTGTGYGSTLAWNLTAGVCYINGKRYSVAAASGVVVLNKDTYFDLLATTPGAPATLVFTGGNSVANNAASPALAANSIRLGIIQSGANIASVAAVNQGEDTKLLPISGGIPYMVTDSLGNLICPRDPNRRILGYRIDRVTAGAVSNASATAALLTMLRCPVMVPLGRKVKITAHVQNLYNAGAVNGQALLSIWDGVAGAGTQLVNCFQQGATSDSSAGECTIVHTPTVASKSYDAGINRGGGGSASADFNGAGGVPGFILVELV